MKNLSKPGTTKKQKDYERQKVVYFPVLDYTVTIVVTEDMQKSRDNRSEQVGHKYIVPPPVQAFHSYHNDRGRSWLFFKPQATAGTVAHECSHAIHRMFEWICAEIEIELFAYHLGYLTDECFTFIYTKK